MASTPKWTSWRCVQENELLGGIRGLVLALPSCLPRYRPGLEGQALDPVQGMGACTHLAFKKHDIREFRDSILVKKRGYFI